MTKRISLTLSVFIICCSTLANRLFAETKTDKPNQENDSTKKDKEGYDLDALDAKEKEQRAIELDNALARARLERELFQLRTELERLKITRDIEALKSDIEKEKAQKKYEDEMAELNRRKEKLIAEVAISQAEMAKSMEDFNKTSIELQKKVQLLKVETEQLNSEIAQTQAKKSRARYANSDVMYLKNPLQKDGTLVISDRRIDLNGVITAWKANYIIDRIQYFNNKNTEYPIFIVIENSPGGCGFAGQRILEAMDNSQAPVHVVVTSYAASMAAIITTLAKTSYAHPSAVIIHHQPSSFTYGKLREAKEYYEWLKEVWQRLGGPVAKKMGISLEELDKKLYEKSARGDWKEYADNAKKLKWVDNIVSSIRDSGVIEMPDPNDYTLKRYYDDYYRYGYDFNAKNTDVQDSIVYLPQLNQGDFYYIYNPDNRFQISPGN